MKLKGEVNNTIKDIDIIIVKSLSGDATSNEIKHLEVWKASSYENKNIYKKSVKVWRGSNNYLTDETIQQDKTKVLQQIQKQLSARVHRIKRQLFIYKIAAILAIPLTFAISRYIIHEEDKIQQQDQFCEITAPKGHISKCKLPDGTEVWINSGSSITYNASLFNNKIREINLEGEAYFKVARNKEKPFRVNTSLAQINVTGTAFNVKKYAQSNIFETVLEEGSIELKLNNGTNQRIKLVPGERVIFDSLKREVFIEQVDAKIYSSWRNGEIIFKDATLNDLVMELERIYDIKFYLKEPKLGEFRFRGMFSYNNNLIDALEKIKRTAGIDYYIENKEVWISKN